MMVKRKTPIRHKVGAHKKRDGTRVQSYTRGHGTRKISKSRVVGRVADDDSKIGVRAFIADFRYSDIPTVPKYVSDAVSGYSLIGVRLGSSGRPIYVWEPIETCRKYSIRREEILGNAWVRYKNIPTKENISKLVKHMETPTGRLKQIQSMHFVYEQGVVGGNIPFSGGVPYPKVPERMTFEEWYYFGKLPIYRGVHGKPKVLSADAVRSWTLSKPMAKSFAEYDKTWPGATYVKADKWKGESHVLRRDVHPYQVLGYEDSNEAEVIIGGSNKNRRKLR